MNMHEYINRHGIAATIAVVARDGPFALLAELGPGPGECRRIEAQGAEACHEVSVTLTNGFIRRDFALRERLEALIAGDTDKLETHVEGEDIRWQYLVIGEPPWVWRLRTYEGIAASEELAEEMAERKAAGEHPMSHDEEQRLYTECIVNGTFEEWRDRLVDDPQWPHATAAID